MSDYQKLANDLRARAAKLIEAANLIESATGGSQPAKPAPLKAITRPKSAGTESVVLSSIRDGFDTLARIAEDAKVKESTARAAILSLEAEGTVKRVGKSSKTRYLAA